MPSSVDNRVVQMTFDNAQFERKLNTTIASLDRLEKSLAFSQTQKNLQGLSSTVRGFNLDPVGVAIEGISKKFLVMSTIAITALSNITNKVINTGQALVKSLTLDQVIAGFREYEGNIGSIQTILANTSAKGSGLDDVTKALDTLNEYSDKTIYNFGQMTRNIGTFTAAGVDLDTSVQSIKGIANLAAISGSSAEQAANAMYQLSQAISTGTLKLIDWNSVVNAGLGGEVFQKALFESGKALKTIKDVPMSQTFEQWKKAGNSFRGSLESGWITAEVLTTTLQGFTGEMTEAQLTAKGFTKEQAKEIERLGKLGTDSATKVRTLTQLLGTVKESIGSGWAQSFRIIFGDFNEATEVFTGVSNAIGKFVSKTSDARNKILQDWKDLGGRMLLIKAFKTAFSNIAELLEPVKRAFKEVFPPLTGKNLISITRGFQKLADALKPSEKTVDNLQATFRGIFSAFKIGITIVKGITSVIKTLIDKFRDNVSILDTSAKVGLFITKLRILLVEGKKIQDFFNKLNEAIKNPQPYLDALKDKFTAIFNRIQSVIQNPIPFLDKLKDKIIEFMSNLPGLSGLKEMDIPGANQLEGVVDRLSQRFDQLRAAFEKFMKVFDFVKDKIMKVKDIFVEAFGKALDFIKWWLDGLGEKMAGEVTPGDFDAFADALNVGLLAGLALLFKKFIDSFNKGLKIDFGGGLMARLSGAIAGIQGALNQLTGTLQAMQMNLKAEALMKIAIAIGILTASLLVLSLIDSVALTKALTAMSAGFGELVGAFALLNKIGGDAKSAAQVAIISAAMIAMASAMLILSGAIAIFASMDADGLARGLAGLAGGLLIMTTAAKLLSGIGPSVILASVALVAMAASLVVLGSAMLIFATLSWEDIGKGMTVMAGGLTIIGIALALIPATAPLVAAGILVVAIALNILAPALIMMGGMSWKEIGKSLTVLAGALLILAVGLTAMVYAIPGAIALGIAAVALIAFAGVMKLMAGFSWAEIGKGLGIIAGVLVVLAVGLTLMMAALPGAIALTIVTVALLGMAQVVKTFAAMKITDLVKGLLGIVGVFLALGIAANLLMPLIPALFLMGAALVVIGAGFALFGVGALLTAKAIEILAKVGKEGAEAIFAFIDGLLERLPKLGALAGTTIIRMVQSLAEGAVPLVKALGVLIGHLLDKLTELLPKLGVFIAKLIDELVKLIIDKSPEIIEAGWQLLLNFLKGIRDHIGEVIDVVADIIVAILEGLADRIGDIQDAGFDLIIAYLKGIQKNINKLIDAGIEIVAAFLKGVARSVAKVISAGGDIIINIIAGFGRKVNQIIKAGVDVVIKFLEGLSKNARRLANAGGQFILDLLDAIGDAIEKYLPRIRKAGIRIAAELVNGMTAGLLDHAPGFIKKLIGLTDDAKKAAEDSLDEHSPSRVFMEIGGNISEGLALGVDNKSHKVVNSIENMTAETVNAFQKALSVIPDQLGSMENFNPTITPVLDLSMVQKDSKAISGFFNTPNLVPIVTQAQNISSLNQENLAAGTVEGATVPQTTEVNFNQTINAPTQLSTADIYRQTRNQLVMAKEELKIP